MQAPGEGARWCWGGEPPGSGDVPPQDLFARLRLDRSECMAGHRKWEEAEEKETIEELDEMLSTMQPLGLVERRQQIMAMAGERVVRLLVHEPAEVETENLRTVDVP